MNEGLLLDTNVVLYLSSGDEHWYRVLQGYGSVAIAISILTFMELRIGCMTDHEERELQGFLEDVQVIPLHMGIAERACALQSSRGRSLRSPHVADAIIAATALELDIPVLTNNPKDFRRFRGVKVLSA